MPTFKLVSFNAHGGLHPRRNGVLLALRPRHRAARLRRRRDRDAGVLVAGRRAGRGRRRGRRPRRRGLRAPASDAARCTRGRTCRATGTGQGRVGLGGDQQAARRAWWPAARSGTCSPTRHRNAAGLHVELDVAGQPVDLIGVHLSSRLPYGPPIQLRRLAAQLPRPGRPAVVAGDCNFWGPGVRTFLPGWRRAVRGRTWPAIRPHSQIDHILVRPEIGVVDGAVLGDVGSDHRPVRATLSVARGERPRRYPEPGGRSPRAAQPQVG